MTPRKTVDIRGNLTGDLYRRLLAFGARCCSEALLVVRNSMPLEPSVDDFLTAARPYLIERKDASEWPGTVLFGHTAPVFRFRLEEGFLRLLQERAGSLFEWREPVLPEDLSLLRADGEPWLATIAHERDAYLEVSDDELAALVEAIPELAGFLAPQSADTGDTEG